LIAPNSNFVRQGRSTFTWTWAEFIDRQPIPCWTGSVEAAKKMQARAEAFAISSFLFFSFFLVWERNNF